MITSGPASMIPRVDFINQNYSNLQVARAEESESGSDVLYGPNSDDTIVENSEVQSGYDYLDIAKCSGEWTSILMYLRKLQSLTLIQDLAIVLFQFLLMDTTTDPV